MSESKQFEQFEAVVRRVNPDGRLLRMWQPQGGVSAQITALEVQEPGVRTRKMIVRRHGERDLERNPKIAADEYRLLQLVQDEGIAAPAPLYLDQTCTIFPTPYLVIEYIEGESEFSPADLSDFLHQLAANLARIHAVDGAEAAFSFLPRASSGFSERPAHLDDSLNEGPIRDKLEAIWPLPPLNDFTLLHGDYWPGNVLWAHGEVVAVIDWEDARIGDPLADVGNCRLEILWAFGIDAMVDFTRFYRAVATVDFTQLPYWDLCAALRPASRLGQWGLDPATERRMREEHRWFVTQAFDALSDG